jgi:hypothetical protein
LVQVTAFAGKGLPYVIAASVGTVAGFAGAKAGQFLAVVAATPAFTASRALTLQGLAYVTALGGKLGFLTLVGAVSAASRLILTALGIPRAGRYYQVPSDRRDVQISPDQREAMVKQDVRKV